MNYEKIRITKCLMGIGALILLFVAACMSFTNATNEWEIGFSKESGFYEDDFYLEINGSEGTIYYTLDSSDPDENSLVYTGPILISDASLHDNIYSKITDVSLFLDERLKEMGLVKGDNGYSVPDALVDKANVVRAICIDEKGNCSDIITGVYFVGFEDKDEYDNINIISIVTDPDNLFDYETGIYVAGKTFDDFLELQTYDQSSNWVEWAIWAQANYRQHGDLWRRAADITFWNLEKELILSGTYEISIQGAGSRAWLPRNLNIYETDKYDQSELDGLKLGFGYDVDSLNLYAGSQDSMVKIKDWLINYLTSDLAFSTRSYFPYELFLDGEYWGTYFLNEKYSKQYFEKNYDVIGNDVVMVKLPAEIELGNSTDKDLYTAMTEYIADNDMADPDNYEIVLQMIDMDSYIDYYATEIYIANTDWARSNVALWRTKTVSPGRYSDGRWRWILYDVNLSLAKTGVDWDGISWAMHNDPVFASLLDNEEFETALWERLVYLADNNFNPDRVNPLIDEYEAAMAMPVGNEYERFYGENKSIDQFYSGCEEVREFFALRYEYIKDTYGRKAQ